MSEHRDSVTAAAWLPDGTRFVTGGLDKMIYVWDLTGAEVRHWKGTRINDLAISADGNMLVSICMDKKITLRRFEDGQVTGPEMHIPETDAIMSLCLSDDSRYLLVNLSSQEIHLWDLDGISLDGGRKPSGTQPTSGGGLSLYGRRQLSGTHPTAGGGGGRGGGEPSAPVSTFRGQSEGRRGRYVTRSCFGGSGDAFVASGGEDSQIYLWHREKGDLLGVLPGHSGTVNAVSWNPANPFMFASASDDHTVRVWVAPAAMAVPGGAHSWAAGWVSGDYDSGSGGSGGSGGGSGGGGSSAHIAGASGGGGGGGGGDGTPMAAGCGGGRGMGRPASTAVPGEGGVGLTGRSSRNWADKEEEEREEGRRGGQREEGSAEEGSSEEESEEASEEESEEEESEDEAVGS
jgi:hypothetical protein